jgi:hypothetical protein
VVGADELSVRGDVLTQLRQSVEPAQPDRRPLAAQLPDGTGIQLGVAAMHGVVAMRDARRR